MDKCALNETIKARVERYDKMAQNRLLWFCITTVICLTPFLMMALDRDLSLLKSRSIVFFVLLVIWVSAGLINTFCIYSYIYAVLAKWWNRQKLEMR
jgi:hypothetical protein